MPSRDDDPADEGAGRRRGTPPLLVLAKIRGILDAFTIAEPSLTLAEIRSRTGYPSSTVQRLVANLVDEGFLQRDDDRYWLGADFAYWAAAATRRLDVIEVTGPVLRRLRDETGETASIFRSERGFRVCVAMAETRHAIRRELHVGKVLPLYAGSSGKVLLAWNDEAAEAMLAGPLPALTAATVTDPAVLRAQLDDVRRVGYALSEDEQDVGAGGISVPVFDVDGGLLGALGLSGPSARLTRDVCLGWAEALVAASEQLTRLLGGRYRALS